jgi:hypothetical protein
MSRVGPKWVLKGLGRWLIDASTMQNTTTWINEVSPMMRHRSTTSTQDLHDLRTALQRPGGWFDTLVRTVSFDTLTQQTILDSYLWHIGLMQRVADVPTWIGAYEKAMATIPDITEDTAIALADQAVLDSQGGGQVKDLADIQRGSATAKAFMTFYSYGSTVYNATADRYGATDFKSPASVATFLGHMSLLHILPAMATATIAFGFGRLRHGSGDDEDDLFTAWLKETGGQALSGAMNMMVGLRELGALSNIAVGKDTVVRGYEGPAGTRPIALAYKLVGQLQQGEADEGLWKSANALAGVLFRYPATQVQRTIDGFFALKDGSTSNPFVLATGPAAKRTGTR